MRKDTTCSRLEPGTSNSYSRLSAAARGYLFNYCGKETENIPLSVIVDHVIFQSTLAPYPLTRDHLSRWQRGYMAPGV
jgi:hypothetical protein